MWTTAAFLLLHFASCTLAEQPLSPSLTARPCLFTLPDTAWTTPSLSSWLKSKELRLLARNIQRYKHTNRKLFADTCKQMNVPPDWNKCSHGIKAARNTMLACSRSILIASLLSDWRATKTLVSRAVLVMPPERWARLGVAQTTIALLLGLQQEGRPINLAFLKSWQLFAKASMKSKQIPSQEALANIFDAIVQAASTPQFDSGISLASLKAILYRHEYGNERWGRPLQYYQVEVDPDKEQSTNSHPPKIPLMFSDSITVLCHKALQWLHDKAGAAIADPDRIQNYYDLSYPVRSLLGVFQNLLFTYDLADSQQDTHTLSLFDKERCPKYTLPVIEYLDNLDLTACHVFEFGAGGSTLWWSNRSQTITAVDTSEKWLTDIRGKIDPSKVTLLLRTSQTAPFSISETTMARKEYDVILIDGAFSRYNAAKSAIKHLAPGGFILLDDGDWYTRTSQFLRANNLIQIDFHGPKPGDGAAWRSTSLFLHRDFKPKPKPGQTLPAPSRGGISLGAGSWDGDGNE
jgi:hypothetical protein